MMINTLNFIIISFIVLILYALVTKKVLAIGKWHYKSDSAFNYWKIIILYIAYTLVLLLCRGYVISVLEVVS